MYHSLIFINDCLWYTIKSLIDCGFWHDLGFFFLCGVHSNGLQQSRFVSTRYLEPLSVHAPSIISVQNFFFGIVVFFLTAFTMQSVGLDSYRKIAFENVCQNTGPSSCASFRRSSPSQFVRKHFRLSLFHARSEHVDIHRIHKWKEARWPSLLNSDSSYNVSSIGCRLVVQH